MVDRSHKHEEDAANAVNYVARGFWDLLTGETSPLDGLEQEKERIEKESSGLDSAVAMLCESSDLERLERAAKVLDKERPELAKQVKDRIGIVKATKRLEASNQRNEDSEPPPAVIDTTGEEVTD